MSALELMARCLRESPEPVTLVPTGPLTNIALLLAAHPELKQKIARIVLMGAPPVRATGPRGGIQYLCGSRSGRYGLQVGAAHHHVRAGRDPRGPGDGRGYRAGTRHSQPGGAVRGTAARLFFMIYHRDPKWGFAGAPLHDPVPSPGCWRPPCFTGWSAGSISKPAGPIPWA